MAKVKRKRKKRKTDWQNKLKFEIAGLLLLSLSIIALSEFGFAGKALVSFFRFFAGEWFIIFLLGLLWFSIYIFWKKTFPHFLTRRWLGIYLIVGSILILSHMKLFENLSKGGVFASPSVILNTWEMYLKELNGEASAQDLGGGMIGAVFLLHHTIYFLQGALELFPLS